MASITNSNELNLINGLMKQLEEYRMKNAKKERYYEGKNRLQNLGIAIPDKLSGMKTAVGWAGTAVDVLNERINLDGFSAPDNLDISSIFNANNLDLEASLGHLDSLVYGISYIVIGSGDKSLGEPNPLITIESPNSMVGKYNTRTRRLDAALKVIHEKDEAVYGTLYLPNETITFSIVKGSYYEEMRDIHNLGVVPVVRLINRPRSSDLDGRSEISRTIISITDAGVRTFMGAEIAREFYSAPQRYLVGGNKQDFLDSDGNPIDAWSAYMGKLLITGVNEEGNNPTVGQFSANSPAPYIDLINSYIQQISSETGIPASFLGYTTANPASADAINASQSRLIKKAEDRAQAFGKAWVEVMKLALLIRDGSVPEEAASIRPIWRSAATPTKAADADAAVKLVQAGILLSDSEVTYTRLGFTEVEKETLRKEKKAAQTSGLIANLATLANQTRQTNATAAELSANNIGQTPA